MKKYTVILLLVCFCIQSVYSEYFQNTEGDWDWLKPHINVGTLVEVDYEDTVKNILKTEPLSGRNIEGYSLDPDAFIPMRAYKQYDEKSDTTFYRLMFRYIRPNLPNRTVCSYQMIYYAEDGHPANLIFADFYHTTRDPARDFYDGVTNMMPIIRQDKLVGLMKYHYSEYRIISISEEVEPRSEIDHKAEIFWIEDIKKVDIDSLYTDVWLEASLPLLDKKDIFRYTIQNAFDGNSATSYVEDTEDDLFEIHLSFSSFNITYMNITQIAIINGYAANDSLYYANNSVISFNLYHSNGIAWKIPFERTLDYQLKTFDYPIKGFLLTATEISQGLQYDDTCLAELNLKMAGIGWLFGGDL